MSSKIGRPGEVFGNEFIKFMESQGFKFVDVDENGNEIKSVKEVSNEN